MLFNLLNLGFAAISPSAQTKRSFIKYDTCYAFAYHEQQARHFFQQLENHDHKKNVTAFYKTYTTFIDHDLMPEQSIIMYKFISVPLSATQTTPCTSDHFVILRHLTLNKMWRSLLVCDPFDLEGDNEKRDGLLQNLYFLIFYANILSQKKRIAREEQNMIPCGATYWCNTTSIDLSKESLTSCFVSIIRVSENLTDLDLSYAQFDLDTSREIGIILTNMKRPLNHLNLSYTQQTEASLKKILPKIQHEKSTKETWMGKQWRYGKNLVNEAWYNTEKYATGKKFVQWSILWKKFPLHLHLYGNPELIKHRQEIDVVVAAQNAKEEQSNHQLTIIWEDEPFLLNTTQNFPMQLTPFCEGIN